MNEFHYQSIQEPVTLESFEPTGVDFFAVVARTRMLNAAAVLMYAGTFVMLSTFLYVAIELLR